MESETEMQIPREQGEKLKRYFINADPFLWGVLEAKNKKGRMKELKGQGFLPGYSEGSNATYSKINQDLLVEIGIEGILERIVVPRVTNAFAPNVLRYFQRCWDQGQYPDLKYLVERKLYRRHIFTDGMVYERKGPVVGNRVTGHRDPAQLFVQIDTQHNFIERWTVFAGLWFEEIEPLLSSEQETAGQAAYTSRELKPATTR